MKSRKCLHHLEPALDKIAQEVAVAPAGLAMKVCLLLAAGGLCLFGTGPSDNGRASTYLLLLAENEPFAEALENLENDVRAAGGTLVRGIPQIGVAVVESGDKGFLHRAPKIPGVEGACPNPTVRRTELSALYKVGDGASGEAVAAMDPPASGEDDAAFDLQWAADAIDLVEQRAVTGVRGRGVRVAVIDSGADMDHPDLAPNINVTLSRSFVPGEGVDAEEPPGVPPGAPFFNHGSHVAGIIAAPENGLGTIGVAPEAELIIVKVLSEQLVPNLAWGLCDWVLEGIVYSGLIRADVINLSLGTILDLENGTLDDRCTPDDPTDDVFLTPDDIRVLRVAYQRAVDFTHNRGATIVAAAGNDSLAFKETRQILLLPTETRRVVTVGATGPLGWALDPETDLDEFAFFSNFGRGLDVSAPGGNIDFSLFESGMLCEVAGMTAPCWAFDLVFSPAGNGSYFWAAGTSMASPHAAGVAALIVESLGYPEPAEVQALLRASADDVGAPGRDELFGHGRVNADEAVRMALRGEDDDDDDDDPRRP